MRKREAPSEIARLAAPLARFVDGAWRRMHWWVALMGALYLGSGITVVKPDEVAVILRWGKLVGAGETGQHGPGLLFAFPRPMDQVVRVKRLQVFELRVATLIPSSAAAATLDPILDGYALTGDQNIVHVDMIVRFRIREPAKWAFYGPDTEEVLRLELTSAMVRSLGERAIDRVLSDGRKDLIAAARRRAQEGLDAANSGVEITSLELTALSPPVSLQPSFTEVQSSFIAAETAKKKAQGDAAVALPQAQAKADTLVQDAHARAAAALAQARGDTAAFLALDQEYRADTAVVRERLYRDAIDRALSLAQIDWIPPPLHGRYEGLRVTVSSSGPRPAVTQGDSPTEEGK